MLNKTLPKRTELANVKPAWKQFSLDLVKFINCQRRRKYQVSSRVFCTISIDVEKKTKSHFAPFAHALVLSTSKKKTKSHFAPFAHALV